MQTPMKMTIITITIIIIIIPKLIIGEERGSFRLAII
jgi:hypothetical protein